MIIIIDTLILGVMIMISSPERQNSVDTVESQRYLDRGRSESDSSYISAFLKDIVVS